MYTDNSAYRESIDKHLELRGVVLLVNLGFINPGRETWASNKGHVICFISI